MNKPLLQTAVVLMTLAGVAQAQNGCPASSQNNNPMGPNGVPGYIVRAPYVADYYWHSSTAAEGTLRGMASMIEAQGRYNVLTAQAQINAAEAHRMQIENKQKRAETYFAMREANKRRRSAENESRRQKAEDLARHQEKPAEQNAVVNLAMAEIVWPVLLQQPKFAGYRKLVEQVVAKRAGGNELSQEESSRLVKANRAVLTTLTRIDETISDADRDAARTFVSHLTGDADAAPARLATNR
jgi:hypothetical protein